MVDRLSPLSELPPPQRITGGLGAWNVTIRTERSFRRLGDLMTEGVNATRPQAVPIIVEVLQRPGSLWPVDSGLSKASFRGRGRGRQDGPNAFFTVINTALNRRGKTYANYVEGGQGPGPNHGNRRNKNAALRTVLRAAGEIRARLERIARSDG